ncbi:hypothetical protein [Chitinophaga sp. 212800010-3]|uniref:hypothetical protein n=1 Tax=unclassified Chitinophaga TaxID=2619133 RepID=UPI002E13B55B
MMNQFLLLCREDAGRCHTEKFTTNKFAAHLSRKPDQAFYLQLTERKIFYSATAGHCRNITGTGEVKHCRQCVGM